MVTHHLLSELLLVIDTYNIHYNKNLATKIYSKYPNNKLLHEILHHNYLFYFDMSSNSIGLRDEDLLIYDGDNIIHVAPANLDYNIAVERDYEELTARRGL